MVSDTPPELASLLSCLIATPGDDLLWLAVADWLEEHGEPLRAELVRLDQRLRGAPGNDERWFIEERLRLLVNGGVRPCVPEIVNSIGMRLALILPGTFWMGSPEMEMTRNSDEMLHEVTLTRPFWMGAFAVTQSQWQTVMDGNPSHFSERGRGKNAVAGLDTGSFPVERVSWNEASAFCTAMSARQEEIACGRSYRLPTEAEWESSCRAGLSTPFHFGEILDKGQANFDGCLGRTCSVGSYPPNAWGLHDMHGNVWEWCADRFGDYPARPVADPRGPAKGRYRVFRGGSWSRDPNGCRAAFRTMEARRNRYDCVGFRVALDLTPPSKP